jgi:hypothetical protein
MVLVGMTYENTTNHHLLRCCRASRFEEKSSGLLSRSSFAFAGQNGCADNVMGTVLLSVLSGHWRYAHIKGVRGGGMNPGLLGLRGTVSEDVVHLAMYRIE